MAVDEKLNALVSVSDYCFELELRHLTSSSMAVQRGRILLFHEWLGDQEPSPRLAQIFLAELRRKGYKDNTIRGYYFPLRPYLRHLGMTLELKMETPETLPTYHTADDLQRRLDVIDRREDPWAKLKDRDHLIIMTLAYTGIRRAELVALRCRDIRAGYLFVRQGKEKKDRVIPLTRDLRQEMDTYIHKHNLAPGERLFNIGKYWLDAMVKGYAKKAGLDDITPHKLRHWFATRLIEKKAELKKVQELMGHASIETTAIYLDVIPRHLDETIELLEDE